MIFFLAGCLLLILLLAGANGLSRARLAALKMLLAWLGALAAIALVVLLAVTGRLIILPGAMALLGPLLWQRFQAMPKQGGATKPAGKMTRADALAVLGLGPDPTEAQIREAWLRVMRGAHPDNGGSDWLAARVNMARDVLLGRR